MSPATGSGLRADDVMSSPVVTVRTGTPIAPAAALLAAHGYTAAPVVDTEGRVLGIVTEADLVRDRFRPEGWPEGRPPESVDDVMSGTPLSMRPEDDLADVVSLMLAAHVRSVPIVDDGDLVGIVTRRDALRVIAREEHSAEQVRSRRGLPDRPAPRVESPRGRIVVGDDGSPGAAVALRFALREAARRGTPVEVVSAFTVPAPWPEVYGVPQVPTSRGLAREIEHELRVRAAEATEELRAEYRGVPPEVAVRAVPGEPGQVLSGAAAGADLLVVGSRGRGAGASLLLGSVGLHCVLHAPCTVTVVRTPGGRDHAPRRGDRAEAVGVAR
ncbi:CBS domain-containing protein [Pseudonocardia sp. RS11V-5]|uniref:CBS domain-containing protein n=1 Tax=Pseudonocardia terrae TaxID=2905831 RepID=UPI001E587A03|nr:CBS domain-containing protein [Pseudonocardia terrae]MCE3553138.1 CBS domain-containing protein [Pseudonocardia terrae]